MNFKKSEVLIVFALKPESEGRPEKLGFKTIYTGVGKVNAAYELLDYLNTDAEINWVINLGTAGSQSLNKGSMVFGEEIKQHDMNVTPLGFELGVTPFDNSPNIFKSISYKDVFDELNKGLIATGDSFVTMPLPFKSEAIEMEAFSLAKVCYKKDISFTSIKYISDGADKSADQDWPKEVKKAALKFENLLKNLNQHF